MNLLKKLSDSEVAELILSLQNKNNPESIHALTFLMQMVEWKKKDPNVNYSVYSPGGDFCDNTFILTFIILGGVFCTYFSESEAGCMQLRDALSETDLISGDFYCILTSISSRVNAIVGLEWRLKSAGPIQHMQECHDYLLTQEDAAALNIPCPDDVFIRDLTEKDAEYINSKWPHRNHISPSLIKGIINSSICVGLCSKESGELLSWALKWYYGGIGVVHTVDHAKRKGYARTVVAALIKRMVDISWPIQVVIIDNNATSIALFTKLGFKKISKCQWFYFNVFDKH